LNQKAKQKCVGTKKWFTCHLQTCEKSSQIGKKLAGITVHGTKRLYSSWLEDVLVFQCSYFMILRVAANFATALAEAVADHPNIPVANWNERRLSRG